jgi:hypothetical protein
MTKCGLAFRRPFCLDRDVPVDETQASGSKIAPARQNGAAAFITTHWSVVLSAQGRNAGGYMQLALSLMGWEVSDKKRPIPPCSKIAKNPADFASIPQTGCGRVGGLR